jgi:hypothetical protein
MTAPRLGWWWAIAPLVVAGVACFALGHVRLAGYLIASALALGAVLRLVLPTSRSGGLAVRSRVVDVLMMAALALALAIVTLTLDLNPRS